MSPHLTCREGVSRLMDYVEGILPANLRGAIDAHVSTCARCTAFVKSYLDAPRILRAATEVELGDDGATALRRFLSERR